MRHASYENSPACPVEAALEVMDGKWVGSILFHLAEGPRRFNTLRDDVGGISPRVLTKALRDLEARGLITRTVDEGSPPGVMYALSEHGASLRPVIEVLRTWGRIHLGNLGIRSA